MWKRVLAAREWAASIRNLFGVSVAAVSPTFMAKVCASGVDIGSTFEKLYRTKLKQRNFAPSTGSKAFSSKESRALACLYDRSNRSANCRPFLRCLVPSRRTCGCAAVFDRGRRLQPRGGLRADGERRTKKWRVRARPLWRGGPRRPPG